MARRGGRMAELAAQLEHELTERGYSPPPGGARRILEEAVGSTASMMGVTVRTALGYFDEERIRRLAAELHEVADGIDARGRAATPLIVPYRHAGRVLAALGQALHLIVEHAWSTPEGHAHLAAAAPAVVAFGAAVDEADADTGSVLVDGSHAVAAHDVLSHTIARLDAGEWTVPDSSGHTAAEVAAQMRQDRALLGPVPPASRASADLPLPGLGD